MTMDLERRRSYSHQVEIDDEERARNELFNVRDEELHEQKALRKARKAGGIQLGTSSTYTRVDLEAA